MGLQLSSYQTDMGTNEENVYIKIVKINLNALDSTCFFTIDYFINKSASDNNYCNIARYSNSFTISNPNGNLREQVYVYLKTLPEFENATDVIEE